MADLCKYKIRMAEIHECQDIARMIDGSAEGALNYLYQNIQAGESAINMLAQQLATEVHYSYANTLVIEYEQQIMAMALSFPATGLMLDKGVLNSISPAKRDYYKYFIDNRKIDCWHLDAIYVSSSQRNKGLGKELLVHVKKQAMSYGFPCLQVFVFASNAGAIRFYQQNDFIIDKHIDVSAHEFLNVKRQLLRMTCSLN